MADIATLIAAEIPRLRRYALALTRNDVVANDLVQDCLLRAIDKQRLWKEGTDLRAWLFTILHNQHVNHVRKSVRQGMVVEINEAETSLSHAAGQTSCLELRDLDRALARLPEEQRAVIFMVGLEGMPYETVAEIIGVPLGTVRSRLSRGREALRRLMGIVEDKRAEAAMREHRRIAGRSHPVIGQCHARRPCPEVGNRLQN